MALKFLNKKGWHTGSLRNIENVWKAEQKHAAEQHKLEELRKQIQDEREKSEFRLLQEQAGLVPRQERLDFLYESGLAVGKGSSDGFKALQPPAPPAPPPPGETSSSKAAVPGALFEDKPQSANDAWRKLHSDPLLLIRQREQEALARIKNNPIKMAMIKKSVEAEKKQKHDKEEKRKCKKHRHGKSKNEKLSSDGHSDSEGSRDDEQDRRRDLLKSERQEDSKSKYERHSSRIPSDLEVRRDDAREKIRRDHLKSERQDGCKLKHGRHSSKVNSDLEVRTDDERERRGRDHLKSKQQEDSKPKHDKRSLRANSDSEDSNGEKERRERDRQTSKLHQHSSSKQDKHFLKDSGEGDKEIRDRDNSTKERHASGYRKHEKHLSRGHSDSNHTSEQERRKNELFASEHSATLEPREKNRQNLQPGYNQNRGVRKMSEEERAARLREMQLDAELHEEQRWKRLKKAAEADAQEARGASSSRGKNFLDDAQKSIYGTEKGGSATIEESVRRRTFYSQGSSAAHESNAFRR